MMPELMMGAASPEAESFMQFVLSLALILSVLVNVLQLVRGNRPQRREVSFADQFAAKEQFDKHVEENKSEHNFLHKRISDGDRNLQEELKSVGRELSGVKASNDIQTQHLLRVEAKIDRVIERSHEST